MRHSLLMVTIFCALSFVGSYVGAQEATPPTATGRKALIPDISLIGSVAGAYFQDEPVGDRGENPQRTGFNLQGVELAFQSVVDPYVRGDIFILFHEDALEVEEARVTTLSLPWNLQVQAGKLLARFGRENRQHLEQLSFVDFSRAGRYFFGVEGFHEMGAEVSVLFSTPWASELDLEVLQGENAGNFDGTRRGDFSTVGHWSNGFDVTPDLAAQIGLSGAFGYNKTAPGNLTQIYGSDLYLRWKPSDRRGLKWQTEYLLRRKETTAGRLVEGGIYSQLVGQFARRWEAGVRYDWIGLPEDGFRQRAVSPVLTFLATEFFRIRAQYGLTKTGTGPYRNEAFLQMQFNMGPHGAHSF